MSVHIAPALSESSPADHAKPLVRASRFTWVITFTRLPLSGLWEAVAVTEHSHTQCGRGMTAAAASASVNAHIDSFEAMDGGEA